MDEDKNEILGLPVLITSMLIALTRGNKIFVEQINNFFLMPKYMTNAALVIYNNNNNNNNNNRIQPSF